MKEKNKPDNLEIFFQRVLKDYEEDPGMSFWERIEGNIPPKPTIKGGFVYKGWMILVSFITGLLLSSFFFYWHTNLSTIEHLKLELAEKNIITNEQITKITTLEIKSENLAKKLEAQETQTTNFEQLLLVKDREIYALKNSIKLYPTEPEQLIKLEIARKKDGVASNSSIENGRLQPFFSTENFGVSDVFSKTNYHKESWKAKQLLFDNQLISHSLFAGKIGSNGEKAANSTTTNGQIDRISLKRNLKVDLGFDALYLTKKQIEELEETKGAGKVVNFRLGDDALTSFINVGINPTSGLKYNLDGYQPQRSAINETAGITNSWNWSIMAGIEAKSKWSFHTGIDLNSLTIVKESINNVRFNKEESREVSGGFVYSFNQRFDGALNQVVINTTILNQQRNDGQDIEDGDLFKLSISTEQPLKIIRLPVLGGYRFDLAKRVYLTPKIGLSAVWKTREQTELRASSTFSDRLSIQNSAIFLTSKLTTESLEANFRAELGYRWRPRWYLFAEPRFKYSGKALFTYKDLELKDSPFHMMLGIRFNVD